MGPRLAVIMAGGSGERFWPLSTADRPKQLLRLTHPEMNMLEEAVARIAPLVGLENVYISTSSALAGPIVASAVLPESNVIAEPDKRSTLGALVWVEAVLTSRGYADSTIAVLTADHKIDESEAFRGTIETAYQIAEAHDGFVTLGIPPTRPETGYGYLEIDRDKIVTAENGRTGFTLRTFHEKPTAADAQAYVDSGNFYWNAGIFVYKAAVFREALARHQPSAHDASATIKASLEAGDLDEATTAFRKLEDISVNYAIMEKADRIDAIVADFAWDDVGSWDALPRTLPQDAQGNVTQGAVATLDCKDVVVVNDRPGAVVGVMGVEGLVLVVTENAVLLCPAHMAQRVKELGALAKTMASG